MTTTIADLINQISDLIEPHIMRQDLDKARSAAHQQVMEEQQARVRGMARRLLQLTFQWQHDRAAERGNGYQAAKARVWLADLEDVA